MIIPPLRLRVILPRQHPPNRFRKFIPLVIVTGMIRITRIGRIESPDDSPWLLRSDLGHIRGLASTKPYARKADWLTGIASGEGCVIGWPGNDHVAFSEKQLVFGHGSALLHELQFSRSLLHEQFSCRVPCGWGRLSG